MKRSVAIIGGGTAGMMLGCMLDPELFEVHMYEQKKSLGRKFLVAGKGGFNLTHASPIGAMIQQYHPSSFMAPILNHFDNVSLRKYLKALGVPTYVGTSKRVFPLKGIKPVKVLKGFQKKLDDNGVKVHCNARWTGYDGTKCIMQFPNNHIQLLDADIVVYALGGSSWKKTGSDGQWAAFMKSQGIEIVPFAPSNCGVKINWPESFLERWEGHPIKNIVVSCGDVYVAGEALITRYGLEGGAIYALSRSIRKNLSENGYAKLCLDLKPTISSKKFMQFEKSLKDIRQITRGLKEKLRLERVKIALVKAFTDKETFVNYRNLSSIVKNLELKVEGLTDIDQAISTVGGVSLGEIDDHLQLKKMKDHYVLGEMLDWDAPTGGYLLQACFSMGAWVADHLNKSNKKDALK